MHSFSAGENSPPLGDILFLKITVEFKPMLVNLKKKAQSVIMIECSKSLYRNYYSKSTTSGA